MPLYFEHGPSPRRVVELDRRDAKPQLGIRYASVEEEMVSEEFSAHELRERIRAIRNTIRRLDRGLARADGEAGAPATDRERAKWEQQRAAEQRRLPHNEALLAYAERRVAMLHAVLAGRQHDDTLPPPAKRETAPPAEGIGVPEPAPPSPADEQGYSPSEDGESPPPDRVAEVAKRLDLLNIPTDLGRPKVRQLLIQRDPDFRVGDADLSAAIKHRRPPVDATA